MYVKIKSLRVKASSVDAYYPSADTTITVILSSGTELEVACKGITERDTILKLLDK